MTDLEIEKMVKNRLKAPKGLFKWAENFFPIYKWENKKESIISSERKKYSYEVKKRLTKNSRLTFFNSCQYFCWIGVSSKRIEIQTYQISLNIIDGKEDFSSTLLNLEVFTEDKNIRLGLDYGGKYSIGLANRGDSFGGSIYHRSYFYNDENSLVKSLQRNSELQYLKNNELLGGKSPYGRYFLPDLLRRIYKYRALIEYAQKINAQGIVDDIVTGNSYYNKVDMRRLTFNFLKQHKSLLKNTTIHYNEFIYNELIEDYFGKLIPGFERYFDRRESLDFVKDNVPVKPIRFQNWVVKNKVEFREYRDYFEMLQKLSVDFSGDRIIMPKDFKLAHDTATDNYNALKLEMDNKEYQKRWKELIRLNTTIKDYQFIVPETLKDISDEGRNLNHCVGSYIKRHKSGETTIVFIRQKKAPETSFYTLEIQDKRLVQVRGDHNKDASQELMEVVHQYIEYANQSKVRY